MTPESNAPSVDPQFVGNGFVQEYYNHLYDSTSEVHKFYLEDSMISRPGLDGEIVTIKSLKGINDQIMSIDYKSSRIEILTADSQSTLKNGVVTLVTGLVIGNDGGRRKFSQSFFLVSRNGSYFVLNDTFRYVSDEFVEPEATKEVEESQSTNAITEPANESVEAVIVPTEAKTTVTKPASAIPNGHAKVPEEKVVNENSSLPKAAEAKLQEEVPKKSFALIVQSLAQSAGTLQVKASPVKRKPVEKPVAAPERKAPSPIRKQASAESIKPQAQGSSIFVANLPMDATIEQLYETFKSFGAIRKDGIQVRSYPEKKNCIGFVAFENGEAVKNVFQAHRESPIRIGNRRASIEEKRGKFLKGIVVSKIVTLIKCKNKILILLFLDYAGGNNQNGNRVSTRNNSGYKNEDGFRRDGYKPRGSGVNGGRGYGRRNSESNGDGKAYQNNGHGNTEAKN
ncbi:Nuclear transport factor 2 (NTF2) family protein with RNA binding (RRM-RBD-RNP motifs) domain-containing protein [Arabidopsis thaliana]|uniref:Nuclear transport factor 2 (NTF2) family protein with RNA binding (RRM-RBD-RNP motifs) domain-containing protein n=1 Tax=Arabidopsis thaliana TaxID=3702 RepID=F4IT98_ARATH|nr:Nuclear transport factor 2 (NTF2) family protein with RNA binding (RRM-RBD-RNP motifs) domain-containing protein [Arabidopsis thaliana]AEC05731.1 Nuclear transport factor 2 (NTF2) family protein with RNA binding (RRM-RBD-RNP motifs) domain-containing protein [Arabidopsis thaliana]|eukprot:NP_001189507.1 Nuclear transport factor 2 (NTF2) family protein with RNA binding (RRM-RBD-RNP motifs) domain-containing protein [Arabidopsis thaliana]